MPERPEFCLPLFANHKIPAWPKHADAPTIQYFALDAILTRAWTTDAHTAAYSVESCPKRLTKEAIVQLPDGVVMVAFIADIDCELAHAASGGQGDAPAPHAW